MAPPPRPPWSAKERLLGFNGPNSPLNRTTGDGAPDRFRLGVGSQLGFMVGLVSSIVCIHRLTFQCMAVLVLRRRIVVVWQTSLCADLSTTLSLNRSGNQRCGGRTILPAQIHDTSGRIDSRHVVGIKRSRSGRDGFVCFRDRFKLKQSLDVDVRTELRELVSTDDTPFEPRPDLRVIDFEILSHLFTSKVKGLRHSLGKMHAARRSS